MRISDVLRNKGTDVFTVQPDTTVRDFLAVMVERRIGACVLSPDGATVAGIVSERPSETVAEPASLDAYRRRKEVAG